MDPPIKCQGEAEMTENKTETNENASDRESSIESFHTNKSELSITTETELIDVDDIELSDEESWLYKSPKKLTSDEKCVSTEKWLQKNIDDMDDLELKATRSALLTKLNELKLLNSSIEEKEVKKDSETLKSLCTTRKASISGESSITPFKSEKSVSLSLDHPTATRKASISGESSIPPFKSEKSVSLSLDDNKKSEYRSPNWKSSEVFDVVDVQKIARLQEESLKQSTYKFLNKAAGKKASNSRDLSPVSPPQTVNLINKPASVEALNSCTDKMNNTNMYSIVPFQGMKKQNFFSSSSALNFSQEYHRGSLPNINKGYYSLKSKKSKRPSEPKVPCPLPVYPTHSKVTSNGTVSQTSFSSQAKTVLPSYDHRESRTLPSSYRVNSRSNSSSRRDLSALSQLSRRESAPFLGNNSSLEVNQRENFRKYSSPAVHPKHSMSSLATVSPTKAFNAQSQNLRSPPGLDHHRATSHSPSRRLPLSTVQHQSPKKGNSLVSLRNGEIRNLPSKVPSKIPSPASRSGIPVPSTYTSRANEDDTWSQDCF